MPIPFARLGLSAALLLTANTVLRADDIPTPVDSAPGAVVSPAPATPATPYTDSNVPHLDSTVPPPAGAPAPAIGPGYVGGALPGGDPMTGMRVGSPYYWSANGGAGYGIAPAPGFEQGAPYGGRPGCGCQGNGGGYGYAGGYGAAAPAYGAPGYAGVAYYGGGNGNGAGYSGDPYYNHFGPGFYRNSDAGHYRFPYYSYRRPWYYTGQPGFNRDTNLPW